MNTQTTQSGFGTALIIIIIAVILVGGGFYFFSGQKSAVEKETVSEETIEKSGGDALSGEREAETTETTEKSDVVTEESAVKTFELTGKNYEFSTREIRVKKGDRVKIVFTSSQGFHDWVVDEFGAATSRVNTGDTAEVEFVADTAGEFEYYCSVGNHRQLGMVGTLIVE